MSTPLHSTPLTDRASTSPHPDLAVVRRNRAGDRRSAAEEEPDAPLDSGHPSKLCDQPLLRRRPLRRLPPSPPFAGAQVSLPVPPVAVVGLGLAAFVSAETMKEDRPIWSNPAVASAYRFGRLSCVADRWGPPVSRPAARGAPLGRPSIVSRSTLNSNLIFYFCF